MTVLPVGKIKVGQRQLAPVRQVATHQQVMTKMGLRPVRRPEVTHHVIVEVLRPQVKLVHRLPVLVMAELQYPVVTLAQQTITPVRGFLLLVSDQTNRRRQRLSAKSYISDPALAVQLNQEQPVRARRHLRRIRQYNPPQHAAYRKPNFAQHPLKQTVLLEAISPPTRGDQFIHQTPVVQMNFPRQNDVNIFKRDRAVMV
ncbi:Uncharacterised protein [Enterobacter hormaechei]|nr:Uncharacterised protein [Enterobacter hormaechei]